MVKERGPLLACQRRLSADDKKNLPKRGGGTILCNTDPQAAHEPGDRGSAQG